MTDNTVLLSHADLEDICYALAITAGDEDSEAGKRVWALHDRLAELRDAT